MSAPGPISLPQRQRPFSSHDPPPYPLPSARHASTSRKSNNPSSTSLRSASTPTRHTFQPFPPLDAALWDPPRTAGKTRRSVLSDHPTADTASESGASVLSAFHPTKPRRAVRVKEQRRAAKELTDSPLRRWVRWIEHGGSPTKSLFIAVAFALLIKWSIGLASYSGKFVSVRLALYTHLRRNSQQAPAHHHYEATLKLNDTGSPSLRPPSLSRSFTPPLPSPCPFRPRAGTPTISPTGVSTTLPSPHTTPSSSASSLVSLLEPHPSSLSALRPTRPSKTCPSGNMQWSRWSARAK
jgi:hypothetical protein